ncbi:hypothetical protein [Cryptosporangium sp. NPDC048952]|uniref:hypothetical protein n=1 Tax=Cryptosporangium sp. NPDC048952 TaxID=3363961 RepID=UPI00371CB4C3
MSITEIRCLLARRADVSIRPTATVPGPFPKQVDVSDRMVCRSLDRSSREVLRAQKKLM